MDYLITIFALLGLIVAFCTIAGYIFFKMDKS